jgi:hypothetical protein
MHLEQRVIGPIAEGLPVAQRHDKSEPNANVSRCSCDSFGIVGNPIHSDRRIDMHDRSDAGLRQAAEREGRIQVRVDRRLSVERRAPEFEILVTSPESNMMKSAAVVMRIY